MRYLLLIAILFAGINTSYALDADQAAEFKKSCSETWVEKSGPVSDKVAYKDFGEKYCQCLTDKPLQPESALKESAGICISQILLTNTMDILESDEGLDNVDETKINQACTTHWALIYTGLTGETKAPDNSYCNCAAPKLNDMNKDRDNLTDKEWSDKINEIAKECSDKVMTGKASK